MPEQREECAVAIAAAKVVNYTNRTEYHQRMFKVMGARATQDNTALTVTGAISAPSPP